MPSSWPIRFALLLVMAWVASAACADTGSMSGRVLRKTDLSPFVHADVFAKGLDAGNSGTQVTTVADAAGNFQFTALPPGRYRVGVDAGQDVIPELYDDVPCLTECYAVTGVAGETPVVVVAGQNRAGVDFLLQAGGAFSGRIREDGGLPLKFDTYAQLWKISGNTATAVDQFLVAHDGTGYYQFNGLPPGVYVVSTRSGTSQASQWYVHRIARGNACAGDDCSVAEVVAGPKFVVDTLAISENNNITLSPAGSIGGCVTRIGDGAPLAGVTVDLWHDGFGIGVVEDGVQVTNAAGCYRFDYLHSGTVPGAYYHLRTINRQGYIDEVHQQRPCFDFNCPYGLAENITLPFDADFSGFDFALIPGNGLSGRVVEFNGGRGIPDAVIRIYDSSARQVRGPDEAYQHAGPDGSFGTYGLQADSYYIAYSGTRNGIVYHCTYGGGCNRGGPVPPPTSGTPVTLSTTPISNLVLPLLFDVLFGNDFE
jgi:hypothetical protein